MHLKNIQSLAPALSAALAAENVSFTTFALMAAVHAEESPPSLAALSMKTGLSYWAARNQVEQTPWFQKHFEDLIRITLTRAAVQKLERIQKRLLI